jgi:hypothetical protein
MDVGNDGVGVRGIVLKLGNDTVVGVGGDGMDTRGVVARSEAVACVSIAASVRE